MASSITQDTNLVLKVQLGENGTRRIPLSQLWDPTLSTITFANLERLLLELRQADVRTDTVSITYTDEDGDDITVSTTQELVDAVGQFVDKVPPVLRAKAKVVTQTTRKECSPRTAGVGDRLSTLRSALLEAKTKVHTFQDSTPRERRDSISHVLDSILMVLSQAIESLGQQVEDVKNQASREYQQATETEGPQVVLGSELNGLSSSSAPFVSPRRGGSGRCGEAKRRELEQRKIAAMIASQAKRKQLAQAAKRAQFQQMQQVKRAQQQKYKEQQQQQQQESSKSMGRSVVVPFIHGRHTCDGCLVTPIVGIRYHATNVPDYDLCQKCFPNYKGKEIVFAPEELDRDRHLQTRWQRRQERQDRLARQAHQQKQQQQQTCKNSISSNASTPKGQQNKAILKSMDSALKEAIRRSLEEALPSTKIFDKKVAPPATAPAVETQKEKVKNVETEEEKDIVVAPIVKAADENTEPEAVALLTVSTVDAKIVESVEPEPVVANPVTEGEVEVKGEPVKVEPVVETKDVASNTSATDTESKASVEKSQADDVSEKMVSAMHDLKETLSELIKNNSMEEKEKVVSPQMAALDDLKLQLSRQEDLISEISCASSKKSKESEEKDANHSRDFSFTEGAEDDVALTIGKALDKCADAIDALQSSHSTVSSFEEVSAVESVASVESATKESSSAAVQSENSRERTILPSVNDTAEIVSMSSEDEWQCVENENDDFAKAAHLLGSALFQSDIASPSPSVELGESFVSGMTSVPTLTSEISQVLLTRYEDELRQLHQLGFLDDHINVNALEHLEAANIGVGSTDDIPIERVVDHILKNRSS